MDQIIFGFLTEIWEVSMFPYLFVSFALVGIVGLIFKIIYD